MPRSHLCFFGSFMRKGVHLLGHKIQDLEPSTLHLQDLKPYILHLKLHMVAYELWLRIVDAVNGTTPTANLQEERESSTAMLSARVPLLMPCLLCMCAFKAFLEIF